MDFSKGVLFDPGYSKFALPFSQNIDAAYNMLLSIKIPHQRKFKFQILYPQLLKLLENTVSFYLGCLLWATFISRNFKNTPQNILDNCYIGQEVEEEKMLFEVNYAINYIEKLKKDCKYYLGKNCNIPNEWTNILTIYKDFLKQNRFLVDTKTTADIKLPETIIATTQEDLDSILIKINEVVTTGNLPALFEIKNLII